MGFEVRVTGGADLYAVQRGLRQIGDTGLGKQMAKALRAASAPLRKEIPVEAAKLMPSGYAPVLSRSLRFRQQIKETRWTAQVTLRVHGQGRQERRDVPALNRGKLKHPLFGNRHYWLEQKVRRGFVDRPVDRLGPEIGRQMDAVVDYIADQLSKG